MLAHVIAPFHHRAIPRPRTDFGRRSSDALVFSSGLRLKL